MRKLVSLGQTVHVRSADGRWTRGTLVALDPRSVTVLTAGQPHTWADQELREMRSADSLSNGGWIGGILGGFGGFWLGGFGAIAAEGLDSDKVIGFAILGGIAGAGLGALGGRALDARRPGPVVFRAAPAVGPLAVTWVGSPRSGGVRVAISF